MRGTLSKGTAYKEKRCTSNIYYRKLHPLGNQRLMPVQINEQKLTIYNLTISNLSADDAHKHVRKFFLLCYTVSQNIDQLLLRKNVHLCFLHDFHHSFSQ